MKKKIILLGVFIIFQIFFTSCAFKEEQSLIKKPDAAAKDDSISIAVPNIKDMLYINIFRREKKENAEIHNVGQIIPSDKNSLISYFFEDRLIKQQTKYQYCLRYKLPSRILITEWSDEIDVQTTNSEQPKINTDEAYLVFDKNFSTLTVTGGNIAPSDKNIFKDYHPAAVIKKDFQQRVIPIMGELEFTEGTVIELRSILPADFFDKEIEFSGFLYEKELKDKESNKVIIHWSILQPMPIKTKNGNLFKEKIIVNYKKDTSNIHDYDPLLLPEERIMYIYNFD